MRSISVVWVVAVMLAAAPGAGSAHAQGPAGPATTASGPPDDQSKAGPKDREDKPKAEEPKVTAPDDEAPAIATSDVEEPAVAKPGKAKDDDGKGKPEKAKPAAVTAPPETPKPAKAKPAPVAKPAQQKPAQQKPAPKAETAQPKTADVAAPSEQAPARPVEAAKPASPRPKAARVAASRLRHATGRAHRAPEHGRQATRRPTEARATAGAAGPEHSGTAPAGGGRVSGEAAPATGHRVPSIRTLAPRVAARGVAAESAALGRPPPRVLILDARHASNAGLLLASIFMSALALFLGWQTRFWHPRR